MEDSKRKYYPRLMFITYSPPFCHAFQCETQYSLLHNHNTALQVRGGKEGSVSDI